MNINKPGVVLITTLLIVMVMSVISIQISKKFFISVQREAYIDFKNQSYQMLLSAESQAIKSIQKEIIVLQEKLINQDLTMNNSFFSLNEIVKIQVGIEDGSNCFNLNSIFRNSNNTFKINKSNLEWLNRLLKLKGLNDVETKSFVDQLIDWVDVDSQPLNFGAEDYFYIGPLSSTKQFTPKRLLKNLSEIRNFPIMESLRYKDFSQNLCAIPGSTKQSININTLNSNHVVLIAALFDEKNLEFVESQIIDAPEMGYDSIEIFASRFAQSQKSILNVLAVNSRKLIVTTRVFNESFSNELKSLVILDSSNFATILNRDFSF